MRNKQGNEKSRKNLIPITKRSPEEQHRLRSLGGINSKNSPKRLMAQKIAAMKRWGASDEKTQKLIDVMCDSDFSALDIRIYTEKIKKCCVTPEQKLKLNNVLLNWHRTHHGKILKRTNINIKGEPHLKKLFEIISEYCNQEQYNNILLKFEQLNGETNED